MECNIIGNWYEEGTPYVNKNPKKALYWYYIGFLQCNINSFINWRINISF